MKAPSYDLRTATRAEVLPLFESQHRYKSLSASMTYCFAVFESGKVVAGYAWQPPPPGCAKSVCPEAPHAVLSLSRMVAAPKPKDGEPAQRSLKHISKPLRRQMRQLIDRTRWPVLVTFSDEGAGHNGFVYKCSGWTPTVRNLRPYSEDGGGLEGRATRTASMANASSCALGRRGSSDGNPGCVNPAGPRTSWRRMAGAESRCPARRGRAATRRTRT